MPKAKPSAPERTIVLAGRTVAYRLQRSRRKTIGLTIDHRGLRVGAPSAARQGDIEALLHRHADWVIEKLDRWRDWQPPATVGIVDGLRLPCLGGEIVLRLAVGANRAAWSADGATLTLALAAPEEARRLLERALRERARRVFAERLAIYAARLGVPLPSLALSSARTRWGSCSSRGNIRLNWRLLHFPLPLIDYVVAHELAHLKEMNHSPRFWSVVESLCPDWKSRRAELKRLGPTCPVL